MAPFKLKFRMGGSRSSSTTQDPEPYTEVDGTLLNQQQRKGLNMGASSSTIDSVDAGSLASLGIQSEHKLLLPPKNSNNVSTGDANDATNLATDPPPLYEFISDKQKSALSQSKKTVRSSSMDDEQFSLNEMTCNDPNCQENYNCQMSDNFELYQQTNCIEEEAMNCNLAFNPLCDLEERKQSNDSQELLIANTTSDNEGLRQQQTALIEDCTNAGCQQYREAVDADNCNLSECNDIECKQYRESLDVNDCSNSPNDNHENYEFCDPLMNCLDYYNDGSQANYDNDSSAMRECSERKTIWTDGQHTVGSNSYLNSNQELDFSNNIYDSMQNDATATTTDILSNKSSKEIYKDLAKQCGITCKLSDGCRCMECQGHYFDCEFDENEHQKTDGGLGAGTPMFISEVMHGTACNIL